MSKENESGTFHPEPPSGPPTGPAPVPPSRPMPPALGLSDAMIIHFGDQDVLVLRHPKQISRPGAENLKRVLKDFFPGVKCLVMEDGIELHRVREGTFWVCGKKTEASWEIQGIFSTEEKAVAECKDRLYFVAPLNLDEALPDETETWPGCYYPKAG